jgi:Fic family protein
VLKLAENRSPRFGLFFRKLLEGQEPLVDGRYLHWDDLRHRTPPDGLDHQLWWAAIKLSRRSQRRMLPLQAEDGSPLYYLHADPVQRLLHRLDTNPHGAADTSADPVDGYSRAAFQRSTLENESIESSLLEGATTTRRDARSMLREGRKPRSPDEQMILNNYRTMERIAEWRHEPMTLARLLEIHAAVTEGTLEPRDADCVGRLRRPELDDDILVSDRAQGEPLHVPPRAALLPERLEQLFAFANATVDDTFIHPAVRAILLHYQLAYEHPFVDGNGRTARALFYWCMARQGYWLCEFVSISKRIRMAPGRYKRAFLLTQSDEQDTTYFLIHQLETLVDEMEATLERSRARSRLNRTLARAVVNDSGLANKLNRRQIVLLEHALRHDDACYTFESHRRTHSVSYQTARTDLLNLVGLKLLVLVKVGREMRFHVPESLETRLGLR